MCFAINVIAVGRNVDMFHLTLATLWEYYTYLYSKGEFEIKEQQSKALKSVVLVVEGRDTVCQLV